MEPHISGLNGPVGPTGMTRPAAGPLRPARPAAIERDWTLPGLCWNASVMTSFGALPVQVLRLHDPLRLTDGQVARVAWFDKIQLDEGFLAAYPDAQPILIRAGALGGGLPSKDILVSPSQKILTRGAGYSTEVRQARDLLGRPGVLRSPQLLVTYYMLHCGQTARISVEGIALLTMP